MNAGCRRPSPHSAVVAPMVWQQLGQHVLSQALKALDRTLGHCADIALRHRATGGRGLRKRSGKSRPGLRAIGAQPRAEQIEALVAAWAQTAARAASPTTAPFASESAPPAAAGCRPPPPPVGQSAAQPDRSPGAATRPSGAAMRCVRHTRRVAPGHRIQAFRWANGLGHSRHLLR